MPSPSPIFLSSSSEERWVRTITLNYTINLETPPCVFQVPQNIRDTKPEAYTPQVIGLGPYHHFRPEVQQMENQKRDAARKHIKCEEFKYFIELVNKMHEEFEPTIHSSYDRYLDLDSKTLSWIMVIDGIFLLQLVKNYLDQKEKENKVDPEIQMLVPDIFMLENQIPFCLLQQIQTALKRSFSEATDINLFEKFTCFCFEHSPLKLSESPELQDEVFEKHMLHYMYQLIVKNYDCKSDPSVSTSSSTTSDPKSIEEPGQPEIKSSEGDNSPVSRMKAFFRQIKELIAPQANDLVNEVESSVNSGYERARSSGVKLSNNVEKTAKFLQQLKKINPNLFGQTNLEVQEIDVPSVSQLHQIAKIKFAPIDGGIKNLGMDRKTNTLYLPVITLRANSDIILRNLMAYEVASAKPGSTLELTEYLDLMCGIIDTESDVKLLKELKIIEGDLRDDEIVSIFNGINKTTERPDEKSKVQKIVRELNENYVKIGIVKAYNSLKKFLARMQDSIKQLFPLLVLIILTLQYVCDIGGCSSRRLGYATLRWDSSLGDGTALNSDSQVNYLMIPRKMLRYSS